jgi:hypothetical protein
MAVDLSMTTIQKIERMRDMISDKEFMPEYSLTFKKDAIDLIESVQDDVKELTLRTLIQVTKIRKSGGNNWRNLATYAICG